MSEITTLGWSFERDVEAFAAAGAPGIGVSVRKLEAVGVARAARLIREAGLTVSCLTSSGLFPLGDPAGERRALERPRAPRGGGRARSELPLRAARAAGRALLGGGGGPCPSARRGPPAAAGADARPPRARAGEPGPHGSRLPPLPRRGARLRGPPRLLLAPRRPPAEQ